MAQEKADEGGFQPRSPAEVLCIRQRPYDVRCGDLAVWKETAPTEPLVVLVVDEIRRGIATLRYRNGRREGYAGLAGLIDRYYVFPPRQAPPDDPLWRLVEEPSTPRRYFAPKGTHPKGAP